MSPSHPTPSSHNHNIPSQTDIVLENEKKLTVLKEVQLAVENNTIDEQDEVNLLINALIW